MKKKIIKISTVLTMMGLGILLSFNQLSAADCNGTACADCPAIAPSGSSVEPIDNTPEITLVHNSPEMIEIEVDCYHYGHCWVCDEYADYHCSPYGWYPGYAGYPWLPCNFSDPVPPGNMVTKIEATIMGVAAPAYGGTEKTDVLINNVLVGSGTMIGRDSCSTCYPLTVYSPTYGTGFPSYVYGGSNQLYLAIDGVSCISDVHLKLYYSPAIKPDFTITDIKPVQVVWNPDINGDDRIDLVAGKSTMVRVEVGMKDYESLDKQKIVEVQLNFDGINYTESKTIEQLEQDNQVEFDPASPSKIGDQTVIAKIDPENKIEESDENNNTTSTDITVKDTNGLHLVYFPVDRPITYFGYGPIDLTEYSNTVTNSGKFISAVYPVTEGEFTNQKMDNKYYGDPVPRLGMLDDVISIWTWGELLTGGLANRSVGIVPDDYFGYHLAGDAVGVTFPGVHAGLVEGGYWTAAAHEIGHTYGLRSTEEYNTNPPGNEANGFWVGEHREISNGICFMGYAGPKHSFNYWDNRSFWIDNEDYTDLFKAFRIDKTDPDVLLISGIISKDGTIQLGKSYMIEQGTIDYIIPGDYSIQILDTDGQVLTNIPFYTSFDMYVDPIGIVETDVAGFTLAIPYPEETAKIQIQHNEEILIEVDPNTKLLHDAIDSIPDYGFINNPEQRRNTLHNKIEAVEKMIEEGNYKGAVNKLESDIKDKLEKWLINDYQKENPEQLSKVEVIGLIQAIIDRLSNQ